MIVSVPLKYLRGSIEDESCFGGVELPQAVAEKFLLTTQRECVQHVLNRSFVVLGEVKFLERSVLEKSI